MTDEKLLTPDQVSGLIRARRSVFPDQYVPGKKIPDTMVMELLENANWAPSHKLTEPWRFTIFSDAGLEKLADFQSELYKKTAGEKFKQSKYEKLKKVPLLCSHVISIGMKRSGAVPEIEEIAAVACAVENLFLSMTSYGIGGYWSTGGITYIDEAKSFFGLGESDKLLGFFYLGYIQVPSPAGKRGPISDKLFWVTG
ncbi:MAG TPA: nitroreductase [Puia sp.]|nr:nitroreductase [Puia sp.]